MDNACGYPATRAARGGPPDEDPIPPNGNPIPAPINPHFHPNQNNHFIGPLLQHQVVDDLNDPQPVVPDLNEEMNMDEDDDNLPGWGHWADPAGADIEDELDQEVVTGEFVDLAVLMQPLEDQPVVQEEIDINSSDLEQGSDSNLSLSLGSNSLASSSDNSVSIVEGNGLNLLGQIRIGLEAHQHMLQLALNNSAPH